MDVADLQRNVLLCSNIRGGILNHLEDYEWRALLRCANPERIVAAAIKIKTTFKDDYPNELIVSSPPPARHHSIMHPFTFTTGIREMEQGFITSTGRFVDRDEGFLIARAAGQIKQKHGPATHLFSEDMW
jgi:hypothetical protein